MSSRDRRMLTLDVIARAEDVNAVLDGWTPLISTAGYGGVDECRALLDRGAHIDATHGVSGDTALSVAVYENHWDVVMLLIRRGANVNCRNNAGLTPLHVAVRRGCVDIAAMLITHGRADLRVRDGNQQLWHQWHQNPVARTCMVMATVAVHLQRRALPVVVVVRLSPEVWELILREYVAPDPRDYGLPRWDA
jgi:hypothetical protein